MPQLRSLVLYADVQFGAQFLERVCGAAGTELSRFDVCGCQHMSDAALLALAGTGAVQSLQTLNLTWCTNVSDVGAAPFLARCNKLQWLSLHGNTLVTRAVLDSLQAAAAASLHTLDVRGCTAIPAEKRAPLGLLAILPCLRVFKVHS